MTGVRLLRVCAGLTFRCVGGVGSCPAGPAGGVRRPGTATPVGGVFAVVAAAVALFTRRGENAGAGAGAGAAHV
ncbi:hypothetical protein FEF34_27145 [Streptomyces marianii]|uniref:Uncharacterized protein n=1 Tax=Streptomyces marianii TaxID=1817406 RepID=A0A5R9E809_9ACTN|nr:hypothetical protein FEF34_27145 [Streptomyces marianii]